MVLASVDEVWEVIKRYDGVPKWWASVFVDLGLGPVEAATWVQTASHDVSSPLSAVREKGLNLTLQSYASARGISLLGAGAGESLDDSRSDRLIHWVSTITTPEEQEAIVREVGSYAVVKFREKINGVYTPHAVANSVRAVHQSYQRKVCTPGSVVLEAGASLRSAVMAGVDPKVFHACCPVLDVRDSVRHSQEGWLRMVANPESKYSAPIRRAAEAALDPNNGFVCRLRAQDCTRQVDMICSNESTHDIAFHDLPKIMARHGAKMWVGFATRAPGVRRVGGPTSGRCPVFGTRWTVDKKADKIKFHFHKDGSFLYEHKFSEWINYEEQFGFRWRGRYFDYVYARMPITTSASLAFVVVRVPKAAAMLKEPVYKASTSAGFVEVTSIKAVGGCVGKAKPEFEPCTFVIDEVVFDRALETRLAEGERGNLASTIAYLRSARVRMAVNGVSLGVETSVPVEHLEAAAVAVEVLAADDRVGGKRDYNEIMSVAMRPAVADGLCSYFLGLSRFVERGKHWFVQAVRQALLYALDKPGSVVVKAQRCAPYVRVSEGDGVGDVDDVPLLATGACGCMELASVQSALRMRTMMSKSEFSVLESYAEQLKVLCASCEVHSTTYLPKEEGEDQFFDADDGTSSEGVTSDSRSTVESTFTRSSTFTTDTTATSVDGSTLGESLDGRDSGGSAGKSDVELGEVALAIEEYAKWARLKDKCARTEASRWYDVLFQAGNPTELDVERHSTARTRHAVLAVVNGRIEKVVGALREEDSYAEVYVRSLDRTCKVYTTIAGVKYIKEAVTELCYTSTELSVMVGDELSRAAYAVLSDVPRGFVFPRYKFVDGVPGAGKTWEIVEKMIRSLQCGKTVMYLTATKASKEEVLSALVDCDLSSAVIQTYDSFVIHGFRAGEPKVIDCAYFDEAPMAHKGELYSALFKATPKDVEFYGDTKQIPWCSFLSDFDAVYAVIGEEFDVERRSVTHRFGAKTCAMWLDVYGKIYPCTCCEKEDLEPEVIRVRSAVDVPLLATGKTLCFTQEERSTIKREVGFSSSIVKLKSMNEGGLSTVTEDQGGTHRDVNVVRLVNKKNPKESAQNPSIYNRQPWVLVATTRHKAKLRYYTVADDDLVKSRIELSSCPVRVQAVRDRRSWTDVKDVAKQVRRFGI